MNQSKSKVISKLALERLFKKKISSKEYKSVLDILDNENENSRHNLIGSLLEYRNLLEYSKNKSISDLLIAFKYISYIHSGESILESYCKSHSKDKHIQEYLEQRLIYGNSNEVKQLEENIKREASGYSKSQFIIKVTNALDFPLHLLYNGYRYQAIEVLRKDMLNATKAQDRINAADKLLNHLNPNINQPNVNIHIGENSKSVIDTYQEALNMLAQKKLEMIDKGEDLKEVTNIEIHENIIDGEVDD